MAKAASPKKEKDYERLCHEALSLARAYIKKTAPYYSTIIYGFIPQFVEGFGSLGVTKGMILLIDPKWFVEMEKEVGHIKDMPAAEAAYKMQAGVLVHEANHILRGMDRLEAMHRAGYDKAIVNKGFDIPINDDIIDTGWLLPKWGCTSKSFGFPKGLTGEQYTELLTKMKPKPGAPEPEPQVCAGRCGGCAGNSADDALESNADADGGRANADQARIRKEAIMEIREATSRGAGNVPGNLKELLSSTEKKPLVPWRSRLRNVIRRASGRVQAGRSDFSMLRPSKRSYSRDMIRPGLIDRKPEIFCIEDSSGSMGHEQLLSVRSEVRGIFKQLGLSQMWFADIDAGIALKPRRITLNELDKLPVHGRGGTDFRPGIEIAGRLNPKPDIVIYLTDGDGPAHPEPPKGFTVVWCIVPTPYGRRPAMWGELVVVSDNQELQKPYYLPDDDDD